MLKSNFFMISYPQILICGGFLIGQIHKKGSNDKQTKRTNCKKHHARSSADVSGDDNFNIRMGILAMNELITKEMLEGGYVPDVIFDKIEEYKTAVEWFETFKFQARVAMEQNHVKKWETDYFVMDYIDEHKSPKIDTKRMKETWFDIVDSNGEVTKVNAYDFFVKQTNVKAHTSYKEKK